MKMALSISVEEEDAETLRKMCDIMGITISKLFESTVRGYVVTAKTSGLLRKQKATAADLVRFFAKGAMQDV